MLTPMFIRDVEEKGQFMCGLVEVVRKTMTVC